MKKRFFAVVLCVSFILALTGCGNKPNASATQQPTTASPATQQSTTQDSGEESANSETTETPSNQSDATGVAVDPASYWQGDNYFDMVGYLEACGCKVMYISLVNGDTSVSNTCSSDTIGYSIFFEESSLHPNDSSASLMLYFTNIYSSNCLSVSYYDNNNRYHDDFTPLSIMDNQRDIVVDEYNNTLDIHTITQIEMLVNKIYATQFHGETAEEMSTFFDDYNQY